MRSWAAALALVTALAGAAALALERMGPQPSADVARGSEDAFVRGAYPRELSRQGLQRWAGPRGRYRFVGLRDEPMLLELMLRSAPAQVTVAVNGIVAGQLEPGRLALSVPVTPRDGVLEVRLQGDGVASAGRQLVALLERASLQRPRAALPGWRSCALLLGPGLLALALAFLCGARAPAGAALAAGLIGALALALWPFGLAWSPYALGAALGSSCALAAIGLFAWLQERRQPGAGAWALAALLAALAVQGLFATSPLMVVSDAVFHANKLQAVAAGDWFPTSVTQHARPFRFPYGVSFYALLAPAARAHLDGVWLVRLGAALSGLLASAALFALLRAAPARAGLAVLALQALPVAFDMYSYGNFSNVFAQSLSVVFFAWWAGRTFGGPVLGALAFALAALAHFSGFVVLLVLAAALVAARRRELGGERVRLLGLGLGLLLAGAYYAHFSGLVIEQLPRLREGAGSGARTGLSLGAALYDQALWALVRWGWPALALALIGRVRRVPGALERDLSAYWASGLVLLLLAVATPLEVRYLYALTLPLAVAAADGLLRLLGLGRAGLLAAVGLGAMQLWLMGRALLEAVLERYR